jgi:hypothetical protein
MNEAVGGRALGEVHFAAHAEAQMHAPFQVLGGAGQAQAKGLEVFDGHEL